jgi:polyphosphate kinase 2 (PPK2 family)
MDLKIYTKLLLGKKQFNFFDTFTTFSAALIKGGAKLNKFFQKISKKSQKSYKKVTKN